MTKIFIIIALLITFTACSSPITDVGFEINTKPEEFPVSSIVEATDARIITVNSSTFMPEVTIKTTAVITEKPTQVATPVVTPTISPTAKPKEKPTKEPTPIPTEESTQAPIPKVTAKPAPVITAKLTEKPTPTPTPVAGEGYMDEMTSASSSYINSVLSAINSKRKANGLDNAILDSSLSSSCKNHAKSMANKGQSFHSSDVVGCEGVSRNHYSMPAGTLGSAMVAHVGQLATSDTNKIGIGIIYYGNYMYVCIRGVA